MRQHIIKYLKWLLPVLFITYYSCVSLFTHVHIEYGVTIVHAHPFKTDSNSSSHHHNSLAEIQLFHILSSLHATDGTVHPLQLHFYTLYIGEISESPVYPAFPVPVKGNLYLRAPPVLA